MKFGVVMKSIILNRFVLHTLQRKIMHLAVLTRKTNLKLGILKGGGKLEKSRAQKINLVELEKKVDKTFEENSRSPLYASIAKLFPLN